jgi:membrane fusion protein (multidrug efflux system)
MSHVEDHPEVSTATNVTAFEVPKSPTVLRAPDAKGSDVASAQGSGAVHSAHGARKSRTKKWLMVSGGVAVSALVFGAGFLYWDFSNHFESTDDAFVAARQFSVAPRVAGYVKDVAVTDNQHVVAGDVIARIDDRDFRVALEQSEAQVADATATIANVDAQLSVQESQIAAGTAKVEQAKAALTFAQQQAARYGDLAAHQVGTVQMAQNCSRRKPS